MTAKHAFGSTDHSEGPSILAVDCRALSPKDGYLETEAGEGEEDLENVEAQLDAGDHLRVPFQIVEHVGWCGCGSRASAVGGVIKIRILPAKSRAG